VLARRDVLQVNLLLLLRLLQLGWVAVPMEVLKQEVRAALWLVILRSFRLAVVIRRINGGHHQPVIQLQLLRRLRLLPLDLREGVTSSLVVGAVIQKLLLHHRHLLTATLVGGSSVLDRETVVFVLLPRWLFALLAVLAH